MGEAHRIASALLNPILKRNEGLGRWDAARLDWRHPLRQHRPHTSGRFSLMVVANFKCGITRGPSVAGPPFVQSITARSTLDVGRDRRGSKGVG